MAITRAQISINDLSDILTQPYPPENPAVNQLWRNSGVTPNELLAWTGKGTSVDRTYPVSVNGRRKTVPDLSENHKLGVSIVTVAKQNPGTPSPTSPLPIEGYDTVNMNKCGKNVRKNAGLLENDDTWVRSAGVSRWPSIVLDGCVVVNYDVSGLTEDQWRTSKATPDALIRVETGDTITASCKFATDDPSTFQGSRVVLQILPYDVHRNRIMGFDLGYYNQYPHIATTPVMSVTTTISDPRVAFIDVEVWIQRNGRGLMWGLQVEFGSEATAFEHYSGVDYTLTPPTKMWGHPLFADSITDTGVVGHSTKAVVLDGSADENWYSNIGWAGNCYAVNGLIPDAFPTPAGNYSTVAAIISSHFPAMAPGLIAEGIHGHGVGLGNGTDLFLGFGMASSEVAFYDVNSLRAWLSTHPVTIVYRHVTGWAEQATPVQINGGDGVNNLSTDGVFYPLTYTGSGWVAVGAVQRIAIESVEITPELGIKVAQILTDGTNTKTTYTLFNSHGLKIYDAETGALIGGLFLQGGEVFMFASALADARQDDGWMTRIFSETHPTYPTLIRSGLSFDKDGVCKGKLWTGISGASNAGRVHLCAEGEDVTISSRDLFNNSSFPYSYCTVGNSQILLRSNYNGTTYGYISIGPMDTTVKGGGFIPADDGQTDLGYSGNKWKKVYAASGTIGTSDAREKHDIHEADPEVLRRFIMALDVDWFRLNALPEEQMVGFIAQQFREAMREAGMPDDYGGYVDELPDHSRLATRSDQVIGPLVATAKLHETTINRQAAIIKKQNLAIARLTKRLDAMEKLLKR